MWIVDVDREAERLQTEAADQSIKRGSIYTERGSRGVAISVRAIHRLPDPNRGSLIEELLQRTFGPKSSFRRLIGGDRFGRELGLGFDGIGGFIGSFPVGAVARGFTITRS